MLAWASILPALKFALPLPRLVRLLSANRAAARRQGEREARVSELVSLLYRSPRPALGDNCFERSLLTHRYLGRLGAGPSLIVAVAKEDRNVIGHVWVSLDGLPVHDSPDFVKQFVPILRFAADGRLDQTVSESAGAPADAR
jgi:hypothetical protein